MDDLERGEGLTSQAAEDVAAYVNYYGLSGDPFDSGKPLFFATPQLEKSLRLFNYLARFSRKLVVITGPVGAGKTTLLENFVGNQGDDNQVCSFAALASDSPMQVLLEIAEQLHVPELVGDETLAQLHQAICDYSLDCLDDDNHCVVVIDDAELFDQPVLELIYEMAASELGQRCGISFLLSGQPKLFDDIQKIVPADMMEKAVFHQQVPAFSYEEVVKYLHLHFIENAGQAKAPFSQNEFKTIFEQSQALPGRINETAKQVLLAGMGNLLATEEVPKRGTKGFILALVGAVFFVGAAFLWWQGSDEPANSTIVEPNLVGQIERDNDAVEMQDREPEQPIFVEPEQAVAEQLSSLEQSDTQHDAVDVPIPKPTESRLEDSIAPVSATAVEVIDEQGPDESGIATVAPSDIQEPPSSSQLLEEVETRTVVTHSMPGEAREAETAAEPVVESRLEQDEARILAFEPTSYTMQLLGSKQQDSIRKILAGLPADKQAMYFEKTHKGAPWYVLIYGNFPDKVTANAAVDSLPKALRSYKPWVRSVSGIQDAIKAN